MADFRRKRSHLKLPIWTTVLLATVNIAVMVVLIIQLIQNHLWLGLVLGSVALCISLFGISFYSYLTIKEIQLNRRQSNFVDSVTHELKTPIAALRLYLDTLLMRELNPESRREFYETMENELERLDKLINQLLEVGRLDAIGSQTEPEHVDLSTLLQSCAEIACRHHKREPKEVFTFDMAPLEVHSRKMLLEMIFGNLLDNAVKYGGAPPRVHITAFSRGTDRVIVRVRDVGAGVPEEHRSRIFRLFFRGNNELERTRKGTGLGLYIVRTLVGIMKGKVSVTDGPDGVGSVFEVSLPAESVRVDQRLLRGRENSEAFPESKENHSVSEPVNEGV
ncbi:MAG TPA: histidine kinase [Planctomycetaceae bacterium]|nr:histidine kinase [Planctomycetaceae bacterium]